MSISLHKLFTVILAGLLICLLCSFAWMLSQTYRRYQTFASKQQHLTVSLQAAQKKAQFQEGYLNRLLNDPEFFERVIRKRLGYSKPDEWVFRFEDSHSS